MQDRRIQIDFYTFPLCHCTPLQGQLRLLANKIKGDKTYNRNETHRKAMQIGGRNMEMYMKKISNKSDCTQ